jgi:cobalt-zinc-cadmium resistance protein CzcA
MAAGLRQKLPGADWSCSPNPQDGFREAFIATPGEYLLKIFGPDLDELERLADRARKEFEGVQGIENIRLLPLRGQQRLDLSIDREKCNRWGVSVGDVADILRLALGGKPVSHMVEGEKIFDISLRWPASLCKDEQSILTIPVDVATASAVPGAAPAVPQVKPPGSRARSFHACTGSSTARGPLTACP